MRFLLIIFELLSFFLNYGLFSSMIMPSIFLCNIILVAVYCRKWNKRRIFLKSFTTSKLKLKKVMSNPYLSYHCELIFYLFCLFRKFFFFLKSHIYRIHVIGIDILQELIRWELKYSRICFWNLFSSCMKILVLLWLTLLLTLLL